MARPPIPLLKLSDLLPGQLADCFALLAERSRGQTRDGKPFFTCRFRDARRTASVMVWADGPFFAPCEADWKPGTFFKLRAVYSEHERYGPQLDVKNVRPATDDDRADGFDPAAFAESSRFDRPGMLAELRTLAQKEIADEPLSRLVLALLDRHADALLNLPGSQRHYYPFAGGWLEHTLNVTQSCLLLADKYVRHYPELRPPLNRDLLVAGAVLHDLGRVLEFDAGVPPQPTVAGRLLGHLFLGRDLVRDAALDIEGLNPQLLQLLEHLIVSHLNLPEWGSPRLPLIPESLILHHADDLDAKVEMYARCLTRDTADGPFTDRDPVLNRQLFKGREV
jgi:3'-5' exoribonuclease